MWSTSHRRRAAALPASSSALALTFSRSVVSLGLSFPSCKTGLIYVPAISLKAFPSLSQKKIRFFPFPPSREADVRIFCTFAIAAESHRSPSRYGTLPTQP